MGSFHGPVHSLLLVLLVFVLFGIPHAWLGAPGPAWVEQFGWAYASISDRLFWMLGVMRSQLIFALVCVFVAPLFLDIVGSQQLLNSSHVLEREKALLRSVLVGGV